MGGSGANKINTFSQQLFCNHNCPISCWSLPLSDNWRLHSPVPGRMLSPQSLLHSFFYPIPHLYSHPKGRTSTSGSQKLQWSNLEPVLRAMQIKAVLFTSLSVRARSTHPLCKKRFLCAAYRCQRQPHSKDSTPHWHLPTLLPITTPLSTPYSPPGRRSGVKVGANVFC